jgi:hypothetical protein
LVYDNSPPSSSDINESFIEVYNDTRLMSDEESYLGESFKASWNNTTTKRLKLRNRIKSINEKVNDYIVTANNTLSKNFVIQDSFTDITKVDMSGITNPANVDVKNGVVTLQVSGAINRSKSASIVEPIDSKPPQPYAFPSNFLVMTKKESDQQAKIQMFATGQEKKEDQWELAYNTDRHDNPATMLDDSPDTWFEYQMINVQQSLKNSGASPDTKGYGWTWDTGESIYNGNKNTDHLDVALIVDLNEVCKINWISFTPYFPDPSCYIRVNDIRTSVTGAGDYVSCLTAEDRGSYIGTNTNTSALDVQDRYKFTGIGTWTFPDRECQFVKFDLTVEKPYDCPIGHIYWLLTYQIKTTKKRLFRSSKTSYSTHHMRVDGPNVDFNAISVSKNKSAAGLVAGYAIGNAILPGIGGLIGGVLGLLAGLFSRTKREVVNENVTMGFDVYTDGKAWRWCLGVKGIDIYTNTYAERCTLVSKNYVVPKGIKQLSLSVSEFIPEEFWKDSLISKNSFIKYYVSPDNGASWYPISPLERTPVYGENDFPAKVISFVTDVTEDSDVNKTFIQVTDTVKNIRLMAELSRPPMIDTSTPVIYDYKIRIVTKEVPEE